MKKPTIPLLVLITGLFAAFSLGFFLGRNISHAPVQLSAPQIQEITQPTESQATSEAAETTAPTETAAVTEAIAATEAVMLNVEESEPQSTDSAKSTETASSSLININTATAAELETLPGIGPVLAQRIIDYRVANGNFPTVEALLGVSGIGEKKLQALLGLVTVE